MATKSRDTGARVACAGLEGKWAAKGDKAGVFMAALSGSLDLRPRIVFLKISTPSRNRSRHEAGHSTGDGQCELWDAAGVGGHVASIEKKASRCRIAAKV